MHILDEQIENFSLQLNDFYNIATIGFTGTIVEQISEYNTLISGPGSPGCGYAIDFNNDIFWLITYTNCTIDLGTYNLQFEFILNQNIYDDINQDGTWDVLDIILTVNHIMQNSSLSQSQQELADLNNDGIINILDIIEIVNIIIN